MNDFLCFVSSELYPGTRGGIGRLINAAAHRLTNSGYRLCFLSAASIQDTEIFRDYARYHFPDSITYHLDEVLTNLSNDENIPLWGFHYNEFFLSYRIALALQRLCRKEQICGIEFADFPGLGYVTLKWSRLLGGEFESIPMWVRLHGSHELWDIANGTYDYSIRKQVIYSMERYCLAYADGWIGPSQGVVDWYRDFYSQPDIPVVISQPNFEQVGSGRTHHRKLVNGTLHILYFGKVQHLKGVDTFIKAAVKLCEQKQRDFEFEIVGMDTEDSFGQSYAKKLVSLIPDIWQDRFHFHGYIPLEQLSEIINRCSLAVIPSRAETFCLASHELNWIGIPLVLNDLPAFNDFYNDGDNCRKFDGTPEGLYQVMVEIFNRTDPFVSWQWNAPEIIARENLAQSYFEALKQFQPLKITRFDDANPLVSIIIPFYNMQDYIDETLKSVEASVYHNLEIILVDDGSTDIEAKEKFISLENEYHNEPRYQFVHKPNGGLGSARNEGIRLAKGKYILPLDSDDVIDSHFIELGIKALERCPDISAVNCYVSYFNDGAPVNQIIDYVIPYDLNPLLITLENRAGIACSIFRRDVFDRFNYDEKLTAFEDWELWWQMAEAGLKSETLPIILYRYRRRGESMFNQTNPRKAEYLMYRISSLHPEYLKHLGDDVFRLYVAALSQSRIAMEQGRLGVTSNSNGNVIIEELNEIKGSLAWKCIVKARQTKIYNILRLLFKKFQKFGVYL